MDSIYITIVEYKPRVSDCRMVVLYLQSPFCIYCIVMFMLGVGTKTNKRSSNASLVIDINLKTAENFRTASILLF
jgi:hypothetical protein